MYKHTVTFFILWRRHFTHELHIDMYCCLLPSNAVSSQHHTWLWRNSRSQSGRYFDIHIGCLHRRQYFRSDMGVRYNQHSMRKRPHMHTFWWHHKLASTAYCRPGNKCNDYNRSLLRMYVDTGTGGKLWNRWRCNPSHSFCDFYSLGLMNTHSL